MPEFPTVNFTGGEEGLFSAEEIQRLMRSECDRATRYGYPVTSMMIAVDRLDQLGDLYGSDSRAAILAEVSSVLRQNTRESDYLGCMVGSRFFAIFPHTSRSEGPALAARLLDDTGKLLFDEGAARVNVTLSIGLSYRDDEEKVDFDQLRNEVNSASQQAAAGGGGRFVQYTPPASSAAVATPDLSGGLEQLGKNLEQLLTQKVAAIFESMGQALPDFGGHKKEVLALAVEKMEAAHEQMRKEHAERVGLLERRLAKVSDSLELTEGELKRTMLAKGVDPGVASIYRTVQGLSDVEEDQELKKEMMAAIFEANMELKGKISQKTKRS